MNNNNNKIKIRKDLKKNQKIVIHLNLKKTMMMKTKKMICFQI